MISGMLIYLSILGLLATINGGLPLQAGVVWMAVLVCCSMYKTVIWMGENDDDDA